MKGTIGGAFTIGTVTTNGPIQQAPVTGTGTFSIFDGSSSSLTGDIDWSAAATSGTLGSLNPLEVTNLTNLSYGGSSPALDELLGDGTGIATISFQFAHAESLSQLASGGTPNSTSYNGSLAAIPEPPVSAALIGFAAFVVALAIRPTRLLRA